MSLWRKGQEFDAYNQDNTLISRDELNEKYGYLGLNFREIQESMLQIILLKKKKKKDKDQNNI